MNISIIIPNFNGEKILIKNLPNIIEVLEDYNNGSIELIISDDNSSDKSLEILERIKEQHKDSKLKIKIVVSEINKGFSSNVNRGVEKASGDILVLLNTDVTPSKNFLEPLLRHFSDGKVFAVGCMDESVEGEKIIFRGRGIGEWKRGFLTHSAGNLDKKNTLWVSGGSGAFRKSIWDKLGGLDPLYDPFYWEDIDLSYRALKSDYRVLFEKESMVRHEHETGAIKTKYKENTIKRIAYRNQFIFVWKNADRGNLLLNIVWLPYHILKSVFSGETIFVNGFVDAFMKLPYIINSRNKSSKMFTLLDNEIISRSAN
jgi:GT2 family glycosyltransferase